MNDKLLQSYREKRDLRKSREPDGGRKGKSSKPIFVIQRHDASTEHYDFRLEADGVFKSWAVPKGPSLDPREKRLAVQVEDHPLDYADFEGVIPEGEYGAGVVMVWDAGTFRNLKEAESGKGEDEPPSVAQQIEDGHVTVWLDGEKLSGGFALTRAHLGGKDQNWLLVKMDDEAADARRNPVSTEAKSVISGRTMKEIRDDAVSAEGDD
jgi:DNA ligase D-like protein (predicted 3'-phosphoesterase)